MQALGMIETKGTLAAVEAADAMLKAADVGNKKSHISAMEAFPGMQWKRLRSTEAAVPSRPREP